MANLRTLSSLSAFLSLTGFTVAGVVTYTDIGSFDAASAITTVETFELVFPKITNLPSITSNGVTYAPTPGGIGLNVFVSTPGFTNYDPGVIPTTSSILTASGPEDFTATFASPLTAIGFDTYLNSAGPATVEIYGASGLLLSHTHSHLSGTIGFLGITSTEPITSIRFATFNGAVVNTGIDNVRLGMAVPEPSALLFGLTGLALSGLMVRRRR